MTDLFFTADEHYGHANIILPAYCNRPFADTIEMEEKLISNHNSVVTSNNSLTFHIGDIFWKRLSVERARGILGRLRGAHALILGNHDEVAEKLQALYHPFQFVRERHIIHPEHRVMIVLDHYAGMVWDHSFSKSGVDGSWQLFGQLFGHSHGQLPDDPGLLSFDVGVDCWGYKPVPYEVVKMKMAYKKFMIKEQLEAKNKPMPLEGFINRSTE